MDLPIVADPADPLSQPTRARLFELLANARRPMGVEELAEALDLHPNGARFHLERLQEDGLIERAKVAGARGRPRFEWAVAPGATPGGAPPEGYLELARWLARVIESGEDGGLERVERSGREIGRELAPGRSGEHPGDAVRTALAALGFQPERHVSGERVTYLLGNCPYREAARESQSVVCTLHRGLAQGLLDVLEPEAWLADFVARDPYAAGCLIEVGTPEP